MHLSNLYDEVITFPVGDCGLLAHPKINISLVASVGWVVNKIIGYQYTNFRLITGAKWSEKPWVREKFWSIFLHIVCFRLQNYCSCFVRTIRRCVQLQLTQSVVSIVSNGIHFEPIVQNFVNLCVVIITPLLKPFRMNCDCDLRWPLIFVLSSRFVLIVTGRFFILYLFSLGWLIWRGSVVWGTDAWN